MCGLRHVMPSCVLFRYCSTSSSPVGVEEDIDEFSSDGRQHVRVQRHDTELVLWD